MKREAWATGFVVRGPQFPHQDAARLVVLPRGDPRPVCTRALAHSRHARPRRRVAALPSHGLGSEWWGGWGHAWGCWAPRLSQMDLFQMSVRPDGGPWPRGPGRPLSANGMGGNFSAPIPNRLPRSPLSPRSPRSLEFALAAPPSQVPTQLASGIRHPGILVCCRALSRP